MPTSIDAVVSEDTRALYSPLSEQLPSTETVMPAAKTQQKFLTKEQLTFQYANLAQQQDQLEVNDPTIAYVCEWVTTDLQLPTKKAGKREYLCLPVHLSEASYFKQNQEEEESKDDGFCRLTASQLRLMQLDRYLAAVAPLAVSTQRLLFGATKKDDSNPSMSVQTKRYMSRRSKYKREYQLHRLLPPISHPHRLITSTNSGRVINVLQGEIAHSTPSQADTLVSDDATTCHIVALWSQYLGMEGGERTSIGITSKRVLATMTHIDGPTYQASLRDAIDEHVRYHSMHSKNTLNNDPEEYENSCTKNATSGSIAMSIHIMGGFSDDGYNSIAITDSILQTLANSANGRNKYYASKGLPMLQMTLETCAVTSANDNGLGCPVGRGLAMEIATGNVFLAEVEDANTNHQPLTLQPNSLTFSGTGMVAGTGNDNRISNNANAQQASSYTSVLGPEVTLRSVRLWASAFHPPSSMNQEKRLHVISRPNINYLSIAPFFFAPHLDARSLMSLSEEELLQVTSTSPEVEKSNFASKVCESLTYMNGTSSSKVFLDGRSLKFHRVGMNGWVQGA